MVVADVDGTLVGVAGSPTAAVIEAVAAVRDRGLPIGFATGRMRRAVQGLHEQLGMPGPHILHNGAEVRLDGATVASWPLLDIDVDAIFEIADRLDRYVELYVEDGYIVNRDDPRAHPHWDLLGTRPSAITTTPPTEPVLKATFGLFHPDEVASVVHGLAIAGLGAGPAESPVTPGIIYVNATAANVDKGAALRAAATAVGLDVSEVLAIGDAHNDLSLLAAAGTAVAMGQAVAEIQAAAHLVAPSVEDDGVAATLHRLLRDLDS